MRQLASVVTVDKVWNLEGKDRVQGCSFKENSYEALVDKSIKENDLVVFIQEGSILPLGPTWKFLEKRCLREDLQGYLIKPQKFAQIKSWGLVVTTDFLNLKDVKPNQDLTDFLKIRKYETEEEASPKKSNLHPFVKFCLSHKLTRWIGKLLTFRKKTSSNFPTHIISKSDETTVQNMSGVLEKFKEWPVYVTAKMEGQSVTYLHEKRFGRPSKFYACSRNIAYKKPNSQPLWEVAKKLDLDRKLKELYDKTGLMIVLQGELCGPNIQNNIYNFDDYKFFVYTMKDQVTETQLNFVDFMKIAEELNLETVPVLDKWESMSDLFPSVKKAEEYAEGKYWRKDNLNYSPKQNQKLWKHYFQHEGVVVRTIPYDKSKKLGTSFKIKNLEYQEKGLGTIHQLAGVKNGK
jgi:hypothetical protein